MPIDIQQDEFDRFVDKEQGGKVIPIYRFTFRNNNNMSVAVITYGATITSIKMPNCEGQIEDIVAGFDNIEGYMNPLNPYFGCTIGRNANRIKNSQFRLNGEVYKLATNCPPHQLHGGPKGFDKAIWDYCVRGPRLVLSHLSPDNDQGFPGHCLVNATFELTECNEFKIDFKATTTKPTCVNLTNHSYFNLAGHTRGPLELYNHEVMINADKITEAGTDCIPTGNFLPVAGTTFNFRQPKLLQEVIHRIIKNKGFDNNFCVNRGCNKGNVLVARVNHPTSGRALEIYSNQPGVQFYTANYLPDPSDSSKLRGKGNTHYYKQSFFCLETQNFPNAINQMNFPNAVLNPGKVYNHTVIYKFFVN